MYIVHNTGVDQAINAYQREGKRSARQDQGNNSQETHAAGHTRAKTREGRERSAIEQLSSIRQKVGSGHDWRWLVSVEVMVGRPTANGQSTRPIWHPDAVGVRNRALFLAST